MPVGNKEKWQLEFEKNGRWNKEKARKFQKKEAEIIIDWLLKENLTEYHILEIGCGNGYLGQIIIEEFKKRKIPFSYHFTDLLPQCLAESKKRFKGMHKNLIYFSQLDVYQADKILGEKTQKIILSTGFASPASYKEAVPVVSKILAPGGILICDFVNQMSPLMFLFGFPGSMLSLIKFFKNSKKQNPYHFGKLGIKDFFKEHDLDLTKSKTLFMKRNPLLCLFKKTL